MSEIVKHAHGTRDRVTVSFTRKYALKQYESLDLFVGLGSDKRAEESTEEAFVRVEETVQQEFEKLCGKIEGQKENKNGTRRK